MKLNQRKIKSLISFSNWIMPNSYMAWFSFPFKAILQVWIYKALYDLSYLGSKTTMTSGEWTCLISFATAPLTCSERSGSEKFRMKICIQWDSNPCHSSPPQESQRLRPLGHEGLMVFSGLMSYRIMGYKLKKKLLHDNTCQLDYGYMCIWTECQTKLSFLISW